LSDAPLRFLLGDKLPGLNRAHTVFDFLPDVQVVLDIFDRAVIGQRLHESDRFFFHEAHEGSPQFVDISHIDGWGCFFG
jgi:hypothetical protein